jgi:hypothetical protein
VVDVVVVVLLVVVVVSGDVGRGIDSGPSPGEQEAATTAPTITNHVQRTGQ